MSIRKTFAHLAAYLLVAAFAFFTGKSIGLHSGQEIEKLRQDSLAALNSIGSYLIHAKLVEKIEKGRHTEALCSIRIYTSVKLMETERCLNSELCKDIIKDEVARVAPEILLGKELRVKTLKPGEKCE